MLENRIKELSDLLLARSMKESECFPVDRNFLKPYITSIMEVDRNDFLLYNLENVNNTYTVQLLLCLPELWIDIEINDLIDIIGKFSNVFSFYALITFTHRYVEINIIKLILELPVVSAERKKEIKLYLINQYPNLLKSETDYLFFEEDLYGVKINDWKYIKQRLLLDNNIKPAFDSLNELQTYVNSL